ncbi:SdrD B-like domain-containing protein [Arundinibacter roseus]|uniref:SD-repeat containing protein B domain-containing protein n=1 Tax=Arundinibacter roseus TaxID=2070510 RepID=A0A4R4KLD9_9BACT|nr:SdrD B-like domain-containing protein [Arundinibacter roseus]TDB67401.1 hypothetical protein EZE20_05490 [Arundinibacter roseus]
MKNNSPHLTGILFLTLLQLFLIQSIATAQNEPTGSISGIVWKDLNNNGHRDPAEPGVKDVKIHLYLHSDTSDFSLSSIGTLSTAVDGRYRFEGLKKGRYSMLISKYSIPLECELSSLYNATGVPDDLDSDFYPYYGSLDYIFIDPSLPGQSRDLSTIDAALISRPIPPLGSVSGVMWKDLNDNGIREEGEPGVKGIEVSIATMNNSTMYSDTTDEEGRYSFINLLTENYVLNMNNKSIPDSLMLSSKYNRSGNGSDTLYESFFNPVYYSASYELNTDSTGIFRYNNSMNAAFISRPAQTQPVDLMLSRKVTQKIIWPGQYFKSIVSLKNQGLSVVHDIEVFDYYLDLKNPEMQALSYSFNYILNNPLISSGYTPKENIKKWVIRSLVPGDSISITTYAKALSSGIWYNTAEISYMAEKDDDSTPNNLTAGEDDIATTCYTVPFRLKQGETNNATFRLPQQFSGVVWYRTAPNGSKTQAGVGNTLEVTENKPGTYIYSFTYATGTCPNDGCCPGYVFVEGSCLPNLCVPVRTNIVKLN